MQITRDKFFLVVSLLILFGGWNAVRAGGREVAVLRTFDVNGSDSFTSLWVVEDGNFLWIRANRPDRRWLAALRQNPEVELSRDGVAQWYRALVFDKPSARPFVNARFREKYGLAETWREWTAKTETVPVRLAERPRR